MNESILIVDDNIDNLDLTQILLEGEGFQVRVAEDADQALKILETYRPHLILMDIQLPGTGWVGGCFLLPRPAGGVDAARLHPRGD